MTKTELLNHIADAMQRDEELKPEMSLSDLEEWDSLAVISLIALYDRLFGLQLSGNMLSVCEKVSDLLKLANDKLED